MFSQTAEYALRAVVFLGNQIGHPCTTAELAGEIAAPPDYLAKVMQGLSRVGIVQSQRGLHGGFKLALDPGELTILDVVNAVDAFHRVDSCPLGRPGHNSGLCPLHRRIDNVMAVAEKTLHDTTIQEVLQEPGLLCTLPCVVESTSLGKEKPKSRRK
ncbi:MAG: Rrf2 family transcriptional regulator [Fuerstiella sp.]